MGEVRDVAPLKRHPSQRVATYRAFPLDETGHVGGPAVVFEAPDNATAIARASALAGDVHIEVWEGNQRIYPKPPRLVS
jgi:hypothetical protein